MRSFLFSLSTRYYLFVMNFRGKTGTLTWICPELCCWTVVLHSLLLHKNIDRWKNLCWILLQVLVFVSKSNPIVLYLRDVDKLLFRSQRIYNLFQKLLKKLSGSVLILGSQIMDPCTDYGDVDERLTALFPYNIEIRPPENESHLVSWKSRLEEDMKTIQVLDNRNHIMEVLSSNDLDCDDLDTICVADTMVLSNYIEEIVVSAISYHLMNNKDPDYRNGKLVISSNR